MKRARFSEEQIIGISCRPQKRRGTSRSACQEQRQRPGRNRLHRHRWTLLRTNLRPDSIPVLQAPAGRFGKTFSEMDRFFSSLGLLGRRELDRACEVAVGRRCEHEHDECVVGE